MEKPRESKKIGRLYWIIPVAGFLLGLVLIIFGEWYPSTIELKTVNQPFQGVNNMI